VSSCCRKDDPDTNIFTALALSAIVILSMPYDYTMIQLLKIIFNLKSRTEHVLEGFDFCFEALSRVTDFYP
jgi:hypothetical protein